MAQTNIEEIHVLSLDGGGSRGIMESIMLGHIMDLSTLMTKKPDKITNVLRDFKLENDPSIEKEEDFVNQDMENSQDSVDELSSDNSKVVEVKVGRTFQSLIEREKLSPIHPTEAFQYIVGTSTGSLIAFGLVGGKKDQTTGKRVPLSVKEVTELYQDVIPNIFKKAENGNGWLDWFLERAGKVERLKGTPITPYTQKFLKLAVDEKFGTALTEDIGYNGCLAGAVARQFNEDPINRPDVLEIFDSKSDPPQLVSEVLLGSSDAPIYFEVPSKIGFRNYIDGGVAGNCPLGEALPQLKKLYPQAQVRSILSLAPPAHKPDSKKLEVLETQWEKTKKMGSYLLAQITDGEAVFKTTKDNHPEIQFLRVRPTLDKSAEFPMDEENVDKMMVAMDDELVGNPKYLQKIIDSATIIALRIIKDFSEEHLDMFQELVWSMKDRRQYKEAIHTAETLLRLIPQWKTGRPNDFKRSFHQKIGDCQKESEQFEASIVSYKKALELEGKSSGNENSKNTNKGVIMHNMAISFSASHKLKEAIMCYKQSLYQKGLSDSPAKNKTIAMTLICIGNTYQELGEYQKACDEFYEKAREHLQGAEDDQATKQLISSLYNNEGNCHDALGHYKKALEAYENALTTQKEFNVSAEDLVATLNNIGVMLSKQGKHKEALVKYQESLEKLREHSGQDAKTVGIAASLNNIGLQYRDLKDYAEAGKWLREALAMKKSVRGNHPDTASTLYNLGLTYRDQGDLNKAKDFHKQAYDMIMACEGDVNDKAMYKRKLGKIEEMLRNQ